MRSEYGITRTASSYNVRLFWAGDKPLIQGYFPFKRYGSEAVAWAAAKRFKMRELKKLKKLYGEDAKPHRRRSPQSNSTTGVLGVTFRKACSKQGDTYIAFWVNDDGSYGNASFSTARYGKEQALTLAILSRQYKRRASIGEAIAWRRKKRRKNETA